MFDPNSFPVANTPENLVEFAVGNLVNVPESAGTCLLRTGRVKAVRVLKRTILVTIGADDETTDASGPAA